MKDAPPRDRTELLERASVVLVRPQNPLNIGSALRAARNMGVRDLRLVAPAPTDPERVAITAPHLLETARSLPLHDSVADAVADGVLVLGFTARPRRARQEVWSLNDLREAVVERMSPQEGRLLLLFGPEDSGLDNEAMNLCHAAVTIPTDPGYHSLNLAQAVLLGCWAVRDAALDLLGDPPMGTQSDGDRALAAEVESVIADATRALRYIEFFKFPGAAQSVPARLRAMLHRARLDRREVALLRGVFNEVVEFCRRNGLMEPGDT